MDQELALEIMGAGENVLLTGPAGSGKTFVLNEFIRQARQEGKNGSVTATTGLAATHLSGNTIHAWSGIGIHDELPKYFFDNLLKGRREVIQNTDVLIIDEISMLHDYRLDMVDEVARKIRENDEPFGGIQVILCGDFFQLPPVSRMDSREGSFVVNSKVWQELDPEICYLSEKHRQNDDEFTEILNAMRAGDLRRRHAEKLLSRRRRHDEYENATELHTTNVDVDAINYQKLQGLDGEEQSYDMDFTGKSHYVDSLKRSCLAQEQLLLKKGALVMCIRNSLEKKYVNGSLGVVVDFDSDTNYPVVELKNGRKLTIGPDTWELRDGDKKRASLSQIPLRLAWAITVHKSQGMTLDAAKVNLANAFVEGMGYVALSRVRSLDTLCLIGINQMALRVSKEAMLIDEQLRKRATIDAQRFEYLRANAAVRSKKRAAKAEKSNSWNLKLEKMRQKYPNAYKPWKEADDSRLVQIFSDRPNIPINELTGMFGRHPGSIRSRLKKHFGEDAVI